LAPGGIGCVRVAHATGPEIYHGRVTAILQRITRASAPAKRSINSAKCSGRPSGPTWRCGVHAFRLKLPDSAWVSSLYSVSIALRSIVDHALEPFKIDGRIKIAEGPLVELEPVVSQSLTLMLHELATNALKYGVLSTGAGTISIDWSIDTNDGNPRLILAWSESGSPGRRILVVNSPADCRSAYI
jgi:hypothetical protein